MLIGFFSINNWSFFGYVVIEELSLESFMVLLCGHTDIASSCMMMQKGAYTLNISLSYISIVSLRILKGNS